MSVKYFFSLFASLTFFAAMETKQFHPCCSVDYFVNWFYGQTDFFSQNVWLSHADTPDLRRGKSLRAYWPSGGKHKRSACVIRDNPSFVGDKETSYTGNIHSSPSAHPSSIGICRCVANRYQVIHWQLVDGDTTMSCWQATRSNSWHCTRAFVWLYRSSGKTHYKVFLKWNLTYLATNE